MKNLKPIKFNCLNLIEIQNKISTEIRILAPTEIFSMEDISVEDISAEDISFEMSSADVRMCEFTC